ncbi:hypothetical protein MP638_006466 [Amoeboaphelidium occidentale]|nr:hypothetical protein MP638_006466 [Amoeboaphelidium occidentale]
MDCTCDPVYKDGHHYVEWIGMYFKDCVYTPLEISGFFFGIISVLLFIVALFPQLYKNYQRKTVEGLSFGFLLTWLLGDISNMFGAFLTNQYPTVKYTGLYFVISDALSLLQYFYYAYVYKGPKGTPLPFNTSKEEEEDDFDGSSSTPKDNQSFLSGSHVSLHMNGSTTGEHTPLLKPQDASMGSSDFKVLHGESYLHTKTANRPYSAAGSSTLTHIAIITAVAICIPAVSSKVMQMSELPLCNAEDDLEEFAQIIGEVLAWSSGLLYFFSRIPQIITNYKLKDVEGLSIALFVLTISSNVTYGLQILIRQPAIDEKFFRSTFPYLLGSIGTLIFDMIIITQAVMYGNHKDNSFISKFRKLIMKRDHVRLPSVPPYEEF